MTGPISPIMFFGPPKLPEKAATDVKSDSKPLKSSEYTEQPDAKTRQGDTQI